MSYRVVRKLAKVLNNHTMETEHAKPPRPAGSFHASSITGCTRQMVMDRLGFPKEAGEERAEWLRDRDIGSVMHDFYEERLRAAGILLKAEGKLPPNDYDIGARYDGFATIEGEEVIIEFKTVRERMFKEVPEHPKFHKHYAQAQLYLFFLRLKHALLVYINRNDNKLKEFWLEYDPQFVHQILERTAHAKKQMEQMILPMAQRSDDCRYCPFITLCDMYGDDEVDLDADAARLDAATLPY